MPSVLAPFFFARRRAARVSAVSPDWDIAMKRSSLPIIGSLYLNSEATSTVTGIPACLSMMYFPARAACHAVPHATMNMFFALFISAISTLRVFFITSGCSFISFSMKCLKPAFSAWVRSQSTIFIFFCIFLPSLSKNSTESFFIAAISRSSRYATFSVCSTNADTSLATRFSLLPMPITMGLPFLATTISCFSACMTHRAYVP